MRKKIKKKLSSHSSILTSKSYVQASKQFTVQTSKLANNTMKVIKIKDIFPTSNTQKVNQIHKIISSSSKPKLHIQMTTKSLSRKQVIILMSSDNISKFMKNSSLYVASINWSLRNTKSEVLVDFIQSDVSSVTVITNKVAVQSDLYIIKSYIKKIDNINTININTPHLLQSKSYLKIIGVPYFPHDNLNKCLTPNDIENIIKQNQFLTILFSHQNYTSLRFHLSLICQSFGLTFGMFRVAVRLRVL